MRQQRFKKEVRYEIILAAAITLASKRGGWASLTRDAIARAAGVSGGLVSQHFGSMQAARKAIMKAAIKSENLDIIAQSIVAHDGYAVKKWLPAELRQKALANLIG